MTIKIEKGVPLPPKRGKGPVYPFSQMEVGDSFAVSEEIALLVKGAAYKWQKSNPDCKLTVRKQTDGSIRVWRIPVDDKRAKRPKLVKG